MFDDVFSTREVPRRSQLRKEGLPRRMEKVISMLKIYKQHTFLNIQYFSSGSVPLQRNIT